MRKRIAVTAAVAGLLLAGVMSTNALGTPPSGFSSDARLFNFPGGIDVHTNDESPQQVKIKTKDDTDVYLVTNTVAPGGSSGWHTHPGPSLIFVKEGTATFYDADDPSCAPHVHRAGDGVIDPGDGHVHLLRNEGTTPLVTVTVQFIPAGDGRRIDAPVAPPNCPGLA
jgi:quercetin dioxygenase-like cupin family protein